MSQPYTQDVVLDADGKPIYDAMGVIRRQVDEIQKKINAINQSSGIAAKDFGKTLEKYVKDLQTAMSQMRTLASANGGVAGGGIQSANANRALARQTIDATRYAQSLGTASDATERLTAKHNDLSRAIAKRGTEDRGATIAQNRHEKALREQIATLKALDREYERIERRASRTSGNFAPQQQAVQAARTRLDTATADPKRMTFLPELRALAAANDAYNEKIAASRQAAAAAVRKTQSEHIQGLRLQTAAQAEADRAARLSSARALQDIRQVDAARAASIDRLRALRAEASNSGDSVRQRELAQLIRTEREYQAALTQTRRDLDAKAAAGQRLDVRQATALRGVTVAGDVTRLGASGAQAAYQAEKELAVRRLILTTSQQERAEAIRSLEVANAKLATLKQQVREQEAAARAAARENRPAPGPSRSPLDNIMSPGYAAAAFARTSIYGAAAGVAYGVFNAVTNSLTELVKLEDELVKLQAIANATDTQMQSLKASILTVGTNSRYSAVELTQISQTLAQAGISAGQMTQTLTAVTTLANASGSSPDEAVQLITSALGSFQLQGSEAARVADLMTNALNRTKLTVAQTGQAIQYVGATAFEQNISLEQLLATIGAVAQAGVRSGSTIGTGFRQFLVDLQNPSEKLNTQLTALGLTSDQVNVATRGLPAVLETLRDAGFGAGQAYEGLETRAAAFYLVAKNNIPLIDQLQLSFATQGAAAVANERAMNSLTAQWQRFKNVLTEAFSGRAGEFIRGLQRDVENLSGAVEWYQQLQEDGGLFGQATGISAESQRETHNNINGVFASAIGTLIGANENTIITQDAVNGAVGYKKVLDEVVESSERLATAVATTTETLEEQTQTLASAENEYVRLLTQKESLSENDVRSAGEIATLTSRFEGLAIYLTNTGSRYDDLTQAVERYIVAQRGAIAIAAAAQGAQLTLQVADARNAAGTQGRALRGNQDFMSSLSPAGRQAMNVARSAPVGDPRIASASAILSDEVAALVRSGKRDLAGSLESYLSTISTVVTASQAQVSGRMVQQQQSLGATPSGSALLQQRSQVEALIAQRSALPEDRRGALSTQGNQLLDQMTARLDSLSTNARVTTSELSWIGNLRQELDSFRNQLRPTPPSASETRAAASAASRADREATREAQRPLVTRADVLAAAEGLGLGVGSGYRTQAEQDALRRRGVTNAATSRHTDGIGQDFTIPASMTDDQARRLSTTIEQRLKDRGITAQVLFETGRGANQGTGRHIHVGVHRGTRAAASRDTAQAERDNRSFIDKREVEVQEDNLKAALRDVTAARTAETFTAAVAIATASLDAVNAALENEALNELARRGIGPDDPEYQSRVRQLDQTIQNNVREAQSKIAEAIVKNLEAMLETATLRIQQLMAPAEAALAMAQARVSGLDYASNANVPEYTRVLAGQRAAQATETRDRTQLGLMPQAIAGREQALMAAQAQQAVLPNTAAGYAELEATIQRLRVEIQGMYTDQLRLTEALKAGNQAPRDLAQGLQQAAEAFRIANNTSATFEQHLINNLGGAIQTANDGLATMFSDIVSGSQTVLGAFSNFVKGMIQYMIQLAAKAAAMKIIELVLNLAGAAAGSKASGSVGSVSGSTPGVVGNVYTGKFDGGPIGYATGGHVTNGSSAQDSVRARLAKGEWVVRKKAVDSVGHEFMANLNQHGSKAVSSLASMPPMPAPARQETNVYVVSPEQKPTMGKRDVLITLQEDILSGGETKKLIRHIAQGG